MWSQTTRYETESVVAVATAVVFTLHRYTHRRTAHPVSTRILIVTPREIPEHTLCGHRLVTNQSS